MTKRVFNGFPDYWLLAKHFTNKQRRMIMRSLSREERDAIQTEYKTQGWEDLCVRNELDLMLDRIRESTDIDVLQVRLAVLKGHSVYVNRKFWDHIHKKFKGYANKHTHYIFGGIRVTESEAKADEYKLVLSGAR